MSGLGVEPWTEEQWNAYEDALEAAGYWVEHCSHCDRSNRHPSCRILPVTGRMQGHAPSLTSRAFNGRRPATRSY